MIKYYYIGIATFAHLIMAPVSVLCLGYANPSILRNAKKIKAGSVRAERLICKFEEEIPRDSVVLLDGDNVRGKTSFSVSKEQLLYDMCYLEDRFNLPLYLYYDHGRSREAYMVGNTTVIFSGEDSGRYYN